MKKLSSILVVGISFAAVSCTPPSNRAAETQARSPSPSVSAYFPEGAVDDFRQKWFGSNLAAMKEPVLSAAGNPPGYFALRILLLPTWGRPVAVRYEANGARHTYRAVMLSGDGGYNAGKISADRTAVPGQGEIQALARSLEQSGYWSLPSKDDVQGKDGDELIIETVRDGEHRVLVRWSPDYDTKDRKLEKLVSLYLSEFRKAGFGSQPGVAADHILQ